MLAKEWVTGSIRPYGDNREKEQRSIRNKIYQHGDSDSHTKAAIILDTSKTNKLPEKLSEQQREHVACTCKIFRTVYYIAKNNRPFLDHPDLVELQTLNGIDTGRMLHSNVVAADIALHISTEMKHKLMSAVIACNMPFSVLIDESTSLSQMSCLIVYLRCSFTTKACEPVTVFLDLIELSSLTADVISSSLMNCLHKYGLHDDILAARWLGLATDGASVMLGKRSGVYAKLKCLFPNLIGWHCLNHRLELSVSDAVDACAGLNNFKIFIGKLYSLYSASPKNRRALQVSANDLDVQLLKIGKILDVRWVASSFRTVRAVWNNFIALHGHFVSSENSRTLDSKERAQFKGLANTLATSQFLLNLALMYDALEELSELSESLQAESMNLHKAHRLITRQIEVFSSRKLDGGEKYKIALDAVREGSFGGIPMSSSSKTCAKQINRSQFYQALVDSLSCRLLPECDSSLANSVQTLFIHSWPTAVAPEYGESELKKICDRFLISYSSQMKHEYRDFKDSKGDEMGENLTKLMCAVNTLPVSTAECERGFSRMNLICTPLRSALTVEHLSSLLLLSIVGPPLHTWKPEPYVNSWLAMGRHAATDLGKSKSPKSDTVSTGRKALWDYL